MGIRNITPGPKITIENKLYWLCEPRPLYKEVMSFGAKGKGRGVKCHKRERETMGNIFFPIKLGIDYWSHN